MAERIAHRDLRNRSAEILRDVGAGATYEITNHGVVVAVLSPAARSPALRIRAARVTGGFGDLPRVRRERATQESIDDLRGDR